MLSPPCEGDISICEVESYPSILTIFLEFYEEKGNLLAMSGDLRYNRIEKSGVLLPFVGLRREGMKEESL